MTMRRMAVTGVLWLAGTMVQAQSGVSPFKLGTFERQGQQFVGIVLGEATVVDLTAAHRALTSGATSIAPPSDMKDLIVRYEQGLRARIVEIVRAASKSPPGRLPYVHHLNAVKILPPIMYPTTMMNVAVNYAEHDVEMAKVRQGAPDQTAPTAGGALPGTVSVPGIWSRRDNDLRWNPFMFLKAPATIIAHGEAIRLPPGRAQIEWECEMGLVIGREARRVPIAQAADYIFGYTLENDVSDRGGRGDTRYGSDWLVTKNHDTFGPMGPFITPKEFVADPQKLKIRFSLNGTVLQEGSTDQMIHGVFEQVAYGSSILTLRPGDVVATGTLPGAGSARNPPIFLKPGDRAECFYEGIGTLVNPVAAADIDDGR